MNFDLLEKVRSPYLLLSGLRGPDVGSHDSHYSSEALVALDEIKMLVTARIRGLVFSEFECLGYHVTVPMQEDELEIIAEMMDQLNLSDSDMGVSHFLWHLSEAVEQVVDNPIWNGHGRFIVNFLRNRSMPERKHNLETYLKAVRNKI